MYSVLDCAKCGLKYSVQKGIHYTVHLPCKESLCLSSTLRILEGLGLLSIIPSDLIVYLKNNENISVA